MDSMLGLLNVLVLEDSPADQDWIKNLLDAYRVNNKIVGTYADAISALAGNGWNCIIVDVRINEEGDERGLDLLEERTAAGIFKIVLTKYPQHHLRAMLLGARRFLEKSEVRASPEELRSALVDAAIYITGSLDLVYQSKCMTDMLMQVVAVAKRDENVLVLGESGSGKELVARSLHALSGRTSGPFVAVNCACLDSSTANAELFGVVDRAYTEVGQRPGIFERANGGDVFLDEIGELHPKQQSRLLRVVENPNELSREGATDPVRVDGAPVSFRVISATDGDPGKLHKPLLERLNRHVIHVPPLNDRREDIPLLVRFYMRRNDEDVSRVSSEAVEALMNHDWAGSNVRGLWNQVARALVKAEIREDDPSARVLPEDVSSIPPGSAPAIGSDSGSIAHRIAAGEASIREVEIDYIAKVMNKNGWVYSKSAKVLGIGRNTLYEKVKRHGLAPE